MIDPTFETRLLALRHRIDEIDAELLATVARRLEVSMEICALKVEHGLAIFDPDRERAMIDAGVAAAAAKGVPSEMVRGLYEVLLTHTRALAAARLPPEGSV
jgi:chorismate mutase